LAGRSIRPEKPMKFAKIVFWIAPIYGILVITPLYFLFDTIGRQDPPPITHPGFFYGFAGVGLAWQIAFIVIATDPARFRLMMIPSIIEKVAYGCAVIVLYSQHRMRTPDAVLGSVDLLFAALFFIAFFKTKSLSVIQARLYIKGRSLTKEPPA
jgi:hypothetical protein